MIPNLGLRSSKRSSRDKDVNEGGIRKVIPGNTSQVSGEVSQGGDEVGRKQRRSKPRGGGDVPCLYPVVIFCRSFSRCYQWRKLRSLYCLL